MRTLTVVVLYAACLSPLWAQSKVEDVDNRKVQVGGELENGVVKGRFWDELFVLEWDYDFSTRFTNSVKISWPMGENWRSPYRLMLEAMPEMWIDDNSRRMGNEPDRQAKYFAGMQYLSKNLDARLMQPLVYMVEGKRLRPYFELKYLRLFDTICDVEVFARGWTDLDKHNFSVGASKEFGSFEAKVYWNDFDSFSWSLGYTTVIN